jgi:hypothetical protein
MVTPRASSADQCPHRVESLRFRQRRASHLTLVEREEISRGIAACLTARSIAGHLGRPSSTVSREIVRNGGRVAYRALAADAAAFERARCPKVSKLAANAELAGLVAAKLDHDWSPQQIARWLRREHPGDAHMWFSHESIYRDVYIPSRKAFDASMFHRLRSDRSIRRPLGKLVTRGAEVTLNAFYRHSRIKQYLKDGRALRIETVINAPNDLGCQRRLHNLDELQAKARAVNARVLQAERVGQGCVLANPVFERIAHPTVSAEGRRATAMRFGDSRVQALAGALCVTLCAVTGITNRSLRALMTGLLGVPYGMTQASYDLARLRYNGLIVRRPHTNTYDLTADGLRFAVFYTKVHNRVLTPLFAADQPQAPPELRAALHTIDQHIDRRFATARLPIAA